MNRSRIAVIGAGISGNLAARLLAGKHDVWLFEANDYLGGHTNTVDVRLADHDFPVDTGFMVFNQRTYPNFCKLLDVLGVPAQDSDMSFSVRCQRTGLEYQGSSLNGLFAQRSNLLRPRFYKMMRDILRFNRESLEILETDEELALGDYLQRHNYGREFIDQYLLPMSGAIWSCPPGKMLEFPARFLIAFFQNHGLLQIRDRPQWKSVSGGARSYVQALLQPLEQQIRASTPIESIVRHNDCVIVRPQGGPEEKFDLVVCATHADQTLRMLADADDQERQVLRAFPYQQNDAVLHTDTGMLPQRRRAWASWNYHIPPQPDAAVSVTYDLSRLQNHNSPDPILLTLNGTEQVEPSKIIDQFVYHHPAFAYDSVKAQSRHREMNGYRRTYYCGAYWGYGFHEDGVKSALAVADSFGIGLDAC
jgi:predicted NAD/FAD-binding protein